MRTDTLLIHSNPDASTARWAVITGEGKVGARGEGVPTAVASGRGPGQWRVVWLLRAEHVLLLQRTIAARGLKDLRQAVPYAVEDELVGDVEDQLFASHRSPAGVDIAVVARGAVETGHRQLLAGGFRPRHIVPDVLGVAWSPGTWSVLVEDERALVRTASCQGFACDRCNLGWMLERQLALTADPDTPTALHWWGDAQAAETLPGLPPLVRQAGGLLDCLAAGRASLPSLNLLDALTSQHSLSPADRRRLTLAAGLLIGMAGLHLAAESVELRRLENHNAALHQQIDALFRTHFPEVQRVVKPRFQMEQRLQALRAEQHSGGDFLGQLAALLPALQGTDGMMLRSLSYQANALTLRFEVPDLQALDRLERQLDAVPGVAATLQSVSKKARHVEAVMRVQGAVG